VARVTGWDAAAAGYERYFVPRFAPWVAAAVDALGASLPDGPILVPCCGTFPELEPLLERFPDREIVGIDLSFGMTALARARARGRPNVSVLTGDAAALDPSWTGRCAAVLSVFGLQQLPDPPAALRSWRAALRPGGRLSVVYWPGVTEEEGPFALLRSLRGGGSLELGGEVLTFPMTHPDAATFFDEYVHNGPGWQLADLRPEFLRRAPAGEWTHHPRARLIVMGVPTLRQVVLDTTDVRGLAEFYRQLLGFVYRPGDEVPDPDEDWLVLRTPGGVRQMAFQRVDELAATTWPSAEVPQQMHLDMTVPSVEELQAQHERALELGARLRFDRSDDPHEPLRVYADPAGHLFCIFVS